MCLFQCFRMGGMEICKHLHCKSHLEIGWVYPACVSVNSWDLIMSLNTAGTGTIGICFVIVRCTSVFFQQHCGTVIQCLGVGCRRARSPGLCACCIPSVCRGKVWALCSPLPPLFLIPHFHRKDVQCYGPMGTEVYSHRGVTWVAVDKQHFSVLKCCTADNAT